MNVSSTIRCALPIVAGGEGNARDRDGNVLPRQQFVRATELAVGDVLLNPLTNDVHRVVRVACDGVVTISVGSHYRDVMPNDLLSCTLKVV